MITFDLGARWLFADWAPNDAAGRQQVADSLQSVLLEGSTDFGAARVDRSIPAARIQ